MNNDTMVLAQIGCGYWGPNLLRNFSTLPHCRVKYVVDASPERRAYVEANFPRTQATESIDAALADPEVKESSLQLQPERILNLPKNRSKRASISLSKNRWRPK